MGVWIETSRYCIGEISQTVTPCMGVWIETWHPNELVKRRHVTPCMGVWIETLRTLTLHLDAEVTPCMGVWIETFVTLTYDELHLPSHPVWVCGLKQIIERKITKTQSHTLYGCVD